MAALRQAIPANPELSTMKKPIAASLAFACLLFGSSAAQAEDPKMSYSTGLDYSSGDYGTGFQTRMLVAPVSARLEAGELRLSASIPWIRIDGASSILAGDGSPIVVDPSAPRTIRSGFGDLSVGASWSLPEEKLGFGLDLGARIKLPTSSAAKALGTGKTDLTVSAEVSKSFGKVTPFLSLGYRMPGDPAGIDLRNTLFGSAGASVVVGKSVLIGSYEIREATSVLSKSSQELFGAISTPLSKKLTVTLYGSGGLSDGAPGFGTGLMMTLKSK